MIVRESSHPGNPCNILGPLVAETPTRYFYQRRSGRVAFAMRSPRIHLAPCRNCPALTEAAPSFTINFATEGARRCGDCQLCCKLLPMPELHKPAGKRCQHQKHGVGCAIYAQRPMSCAAWTCRWLVNDDTADLRRPDRSRYVIDVMPDFVTLKPDDGSEPYNVPVVQIWCDPHAPEAWRDPALLAYLDRRGQDGTAALIRYDNKRGITVFPPSMTGDTWREYRNGTLRLEHTMAEKVAAISTAPKIVPHA